MPETAHRTPRAGHGAAADHQLVTLAFAADHFSVHPRTLRRRIADGTITAYRIGRMIRVDLDEVGPALVTTVTGRRTRA